MPYLLNCPGCGARLRVQDDAGQERFSCPRCLAPVPVRGGSVDDGIVDVLPARPVPQRDRPLPARRSVNLRLADADVRRDTGSAAVGLGLLGILLLVAIALTFISGYSTGQGFRKSSSRAAQTLVPVALLGAGLLALAAPVPVMVRMFRGHDLGAGRVLLAVVLYFGILVTTVVALFALFFVACLAGV